MSARLRSARGCSTYPSSRCRWIRVTGLRELEAVWTVKHDHRRIQRDPNGRSLLEGVRSLRYNPRKVSVYFGVFGKTASFLVDASTEGSRNLITNLHRNAEVRSSLDDDPRKVASEDRSWVGDTPSVYGREGQRLFVSLPLRTDVRFQSVWLMAIAETLTRISFSSTVGVGRSSVLTVVSAWTMTARWVFGISELDISRVCQSPVWVGICAVIYAALSEIVGLIIPAPYLMCTVLMGEY